MYISKPYLYNQKKIQTHYPRVAVELSISSDQIIICGSPAQPKNRNADLKPPLNRP